jgi:hypothetical protein
MLAALAFAVVFGAVVSAAGGEGADVLGPDAIGVGAGVGVGCTGGATVTRMVRVPVLSPALPDP